MRQVVFYFDFASPLAWLAFEQLPEALAGISHWVDYSPLPRERFEAAQAADVLRSPAPTWDEEVGRARSIAAAFDTPYVPPAQPFDARPLLAIAHGSARAGFGPNRYAVERVMRHVWQSGGGDPCRNDRLAELAAALGAPSVLDGEARAQAAVTAAAAQGITGLPAFAVPSLGVFLMGYEALAQLSEAMARR